MTDACRPLSIPDAPQLIRKLLSWYQEHRRDLPWRRERDPYHIWLSEIMLQQTQVETALPYFERFLAKYPCLEDLARAEEAEVLSLWSGLGYYSRARNLRRAAQIVCEEFEGRFPIDYQQALKLPGIGRYTAGAILSIAYDQSLPILDGNIRRLMARLLACEEPSDRLDKLLWPLLTALIREPEAERHIADFNQSLMELGALICRPRNPRCQECPVKDHCRGYSRGIQGKLPRKKAARSTEEFLYTVAVIERDGKWLFRKGHGDSFLTGFWELPRIPGSPTESSEKEFFLEHHLSLRTLAGYPPIRHQITYRRLQFFPITSELSGCPGGPTWRWARLGETDLPVASYTKKILKEVLQQYGQKTFRYNLADDST